MIDNENIFNGKINENIKPKDSEYIHKDSFDKIFSLQKLIHKQAGLKQLCKIINL